MRIGKLRFKMLLQNPVATHTGGGSYSITWTDAGDIWCDKVGLTSQEKFLAQQASSQATHKITTRYSDSISTRSRLVEAPGAIGSGTGGDRVVSTSRLYQVESCVDPDGRKRELQLTCVERS